MLASSSGLYDALVTLHVVCAVVGFGAVAISGVYGGLARDASNSAEIGRYFAGTGRAEWLVVAVPFFGLAAILAGDHSSALADTWVVGGSVIWAAATILLLVVVRPAERRIRTGRDVAGSGRALMLAGVSSDALFVAALALMITQPK